MATIATEPVRLVKTRDGKSGEFDEILCAGTEIAGDVCVKTNNALIVCSDAAVVMTHLMVTSGANVLPGAVALTTNALKIKPGDTFQMNGWASTAATAVCADSLLDAQGNYPIVKKTVSGSVTWCMDLDNITTNPSVRLISRIDSATDQYPRLLVEFLPTVTQES